MKIHTVKLKGGFDMCEQKALALYDFASKQEFIYRTSKIREISGASAMLSDMYRKFTEILDKNEAAVKIKYNLDEKFTIDGFDKNDEIDAEVLYDGGGNLMVIYKNRDKYIEANKIFSSWILKNCPTLSLIACCVPFTGDFEKDRKTLYEENAKRKNRYPSSDLPCVTPMSQIDPLTFLPVTHKASYPYEQSLSADRLAKQKWFVPDPNDKLENLDSMTAVIYIDGNSMGSKLQKCRSSDYNDGVAKLRSFSRGVNELFVVKPLKTIAEMLRHKGYRRVIGGGDEITIICEAELAWRVVCKYFEVLESEMLEITDSSGNVVEKSICTSCAGIAVFHAKDPFNVAYDIAEAACESAKEKAHLKDGNYFDFYYCHAGITNDFDTLRKIEQEHTTARPYMISQAKKVFEEKLPTLHAAGRANVKSLGNAAQESYEKYLLEVKRINSYLPPNVPKFNESADDMRIIYDMSEFYDLWFSKEDEINEEET